MSLFAPVESEPNLIIIPATMPSVQSVPDANVAVTPVPDAASGVPMPGER